MSGSPPIPGLSGSPISNGSGAQKIGGDAKSGNGDFSGGMGGYFSGPTLDKSRGLKLTHLAAMGGLALAGLLIWKKG